MLGPTSTTLQERDELGLLLGNPSRPCGRRAARWSRPLPAQLGRALINAQP